MTSTQERRATMDIHNRERCVRRRLARSNMRLLKSPSRSHARAWYGPGYMVVNAENYVVLGASNRAFEATLDQVSAWVAATGTEIASQ